MRVTGRAEVDWCAILLVANEMEVLVGDRGYCFCRRFVAEADDSGHLWVRHPPGCYGSFLLRGERLVPEIIRSWQGCRETNLFGYVRHVVPPVIPV